MTLKKLGTTGILKKLDNHTLAYKSEGKYHPNFSIVYSKDTILTDGLNNKKVKITIEVVD